MTLRHFIDLFRGYVQSEKTFSYKSLASGALILGIIGIADNKPVDLCYRCYKYFYHIFRNAYNTKIYRDTNRK